MSKYSVFIPGQPLSTSFFVSMIYDGAAPFRAPILYLSTMRFLACGLSGRHLPQSTRGSNTVHDRTTSLPTFVLRWGNSRRGDATLRSLQKLGGGKASRRGKKGRAFQIDGLLLWGGGGLCGLRGFRCRLMRTRRIRDDHTRGGGRWAPGRQPSLRLKSAGDVRLL